MQEPDERSGDGSLKFYIADVSKEWWKWESPEKTKDLDFVKDFVVSKEELKEDGMWMKFLYQASCKLNLEEAANYGWALLPRVPGESVGVFEVKDLSEVQENSLIVLSLSDDVPTSPIPPEIYLSKVAEVKEVLGDLPEAMILQVLQEQEGDVQATILRVIEMDESEHNKYMDNCSEPSLKKPKVEEKSTQEEGKKADNKKGKEKDDDSNSENESMVCENNSSGINKIKLLSLEEKEEGKIASLQELCLVAAKTEWDEVAGSMLQLPADLQDQVVDYMWKNGMFEDSMVDVGDSGDLMDMNDMFADLLNDDSLEGEYVDIFSSDAQGRDLRSSGGGSMIDLELARAFQQMEKEAEMAMKKIIEEDEKYARQLAAEERQEEEDDFEFAKLLAAQEKEEQEMAAMHKKDEEYARKLMELEEKAQQERDRREEEDARLAQKLMNLENQQGADAEYARKLLEEERSALEQQRKLREAEDERLAKEIQKKYEEEVKSQQLIKQLQEEEKRREREEAEKKRREEEASKKLIEKLLEDQKPKPLDESSDDWKKSRFFDDTTGMANFIQAQKASQQIKVKKIIKPALAQRFEKQWMQFIAKYGAKSIEAKPRIAYHGTNSNFIPSIQEKGLLVPGGASGVKHKTDSGWYGRGIYLSPNPGLSLGYTQGGKMLVCSVLMGKIYKCPGRMDGQPLKKGYDSHESPCGQEYIIFNCCQVLPCYVIEITPKATPSPYLPTPTTTYYNTYPPPAPPPKSCSVQ